MKQRVGQIAQMVRPRCPLSEVRVLSYHSIVARAQDDPMQMTTPVALFDEQMAFLATHGYHVESARSVVQGIRQGESPHPKTVVLTFDDGYADNYHLALPVLQRYRFPATLFVIAGALNGAHERLYNRWEGPYLNWQQAREMHASGLIQIGCHSATHRNLRGLPADLLKEETAGARRSLEDGLRSPVYLFAYPFGSHGSWDAAARQAVETAGFLGAFTTIYGGNTASSDPWLLKRLRISWREEIPEFERLLQGAYDWYVWVQWLQAPMTRSR